MDAGEDEGRMMALAKDAQFRLMLKLLAFDRTDEEKGESDAAPERAKAQPS